MEKQISLVCDVKDFLPLDELHPFQGDLKSLDSVSFAKLKKEILDTGFAYPVYVWTDIDNIHWIIGGHQRVRVLKHLRDIEHYNVSLVPVVYIKANNKVEAKRRVLQDVAQYGTIERQGLYEFLHDAQISIQSLSDSFKLPDIDITSFGDEFFSAPDFMPGTLDEQGKLDEKKPLVVICPGCGEEFDANKNCIKD